MPTPSRPASPTKSPRAQTTDAPSNRQKPRVSSAASRPLASIKTSTLASSAPTPSALSASERAAQALREKLLKARAIAAPPNRAPDVTANVPAPRRRAKPALKPEVVSRSEANTRRRSGFETRAQIIERLNNPMLSLQETSLILRVCPATVRRYSNSGVLPHVRTEGNQRRFRWRDVQLLMREMEARRK